MLGCRLSLALFALATTVVLQGLGAVWVLNQAQGRDLRVLLGDAADPDADGDDHARRPRHRAAPGRRRLPLCKPFEFEELLARLEALARRGRATRARQSAPLAVADLVFDRKRMRVTRAGRAVALTARELALLELLMNAPGRLFSRERILASVWGTHEDPLTNIVDVYIRRLRSKVDEGFEPALIHTQRSLGYRLEVPAG
jgi:DNA-binding winged helix-turn-helix (wHTH) protein